jgi:tyrosine-protein kinase Etk/Wzc
MDDIQKQSSNNDKQQDMIQEDEINLLDYLRVGYKFRRMIVLICVVAVVTTAIYSLLSPKIYSATASVVPPIEILQRDSELAGGLGAGESSILRKAMGVTSIANMYAGILESRAVVDAIIDRFDLMKVYEEKEYKSNVRKRLRKNTTIKVSDEGILSVTVEDRDPNRAADIANAYVEELDQRNRLLSSGQATSKRIFLENRLKEIEQELTKIEDLLSRETKIKEMLFELLMRECELAKIEEAKSMPTIQVLDKAVVPEIRMPRGTKRKTALAGAVSLMLAVFAAFAREYFAKVREKEAEKRLRLSFEAGQQNVNDSTFSELANKRKIVAAHRRKRAQENKSYSREAETS